MIPNQVAVGDQGNAMAIGYHAAADRIEVEIGTPSGCCLDVGCNTGAGMAALAARWPGTAWFGLEPVAEFAEMSRARGYEVACAPGEKMPFEDNAFDFVFSRHSLEHVADRARVISEIWRVLKPGGRLYIQAPIEPTGSPNALHRSPFRSQDELLRAFISEPPGSSDPWRLLYLGPQPTVCELILEKQTPWL